MVCLSVCDATSIRCSARELKLLPVATARYGDRADTMPSGRSLILSRARRPGREQLAVRHNESAFFPDPIEYPPGYGVGSQIVTIFAA